MVLHVVIDFIGLQAYIGFVSFLRCSLICHVLFPDLGELSRKFPEKIPFFFPPKSGKTSDPENQCRKLSNPSPRPGNENIMSIIRTNPKRGVSVVTRPHGTHTGSISDGPPIALRTSGDCVFRDKSGILCPIH